MNLTLTLMLALAGGMGIPLGAVLSTSTWLRSTCQEHEIDSFVSYFGGGALLAAVTLVLIPQGIEGASLVPVAVAFLAGGLSFLGLVWWINRSGNRAAQLMGMVTDFVPESIALGAAAASGSGTGYLLAGLIALQNIPEGFASYHELRDSGMASGRLWSIFLLAPLLGPLAAGIGWGWLANHEQSLGLLMMFCSGGIIYLIFDDIAPNAHVKYEAFPAVGAVSGYLLGMVGTIWVH